MDYGVAKQELAGRINAFTEYATRHAIVRPVAISISIADNPYILWVERATRGWAVYIAPGLLLPDKKGCGAFMAVDASLEIMAAVVSALPLLVDEMRRVKELHTRAAQDAIAAFDASDIGQAIAGN